MFSKKLLIIFILSSASQISSAQIPESETSGNAQNGFYGSNSHLLHELRMQLERNPFGIEGIAASIGVSLECRKLPFQMTCLGYRQLPGPFNFVDPKVPVFNAVQRHVNGRLQVEHFLNLKGVDSIDLAHCIVGELVSKEFQSGNWRQGRVASKTIPPHDGNIYLDSFNFEVQSKYSVHLITSLTPNVCSGFFYISAKEE